MTKIQPLKLRQPSEVFQACVRDLGAAKIQVLELPQSFEMFEPGVTDARLQAPAIGAASFVRGELTPGSVTSVRPRPSERRRRNPLEMCQPGVRDSAAKEVQPFQLR